MEKLCNWWISTICAGLFARIIR